MKQVIERCDICKRIYDRGPRFKGSFWMRELGYDKEHDEVCHSCIDALKRIYKELRNDLPEVKE